MDGYRYHGCSPENWLAVIWMDYMLAGVIERLHGPEGFDAIVWC